MISRESLLDFIIRRLAEQQIQVNPDDDLLTGGQVDSIAMMRLITEIEAELGTKVPPDALVPENFLTPRVTAGFLANLERNRG